MNRVRIDEIILKTFQTTGRKLTYTELGGMVLKGEKKAPYGKAKPKPYSERDGRMYMGRLNRGSIRGIPLRHIQRLAEIAKTKDIHELFQFD